MATSENEADRGGRKRPINEDSSDSDVDEDELLKSDNETVDNDHDICDELIGNMGNMKVDSISDGEDDEGEEASSKRTHGLELRDYQLELTELAIQGQNTIVHAVTGAGKTRVALYIVKDHLEKNPDGKVAFMAEKNFLVTQHFESLKKILPEYIDKTVCISAQKEKSDNLLIDHYQIILITPALVENALLKAEEGLDLLSKFTLLVFDECHHTKKKSSYNRLMVQYHMLQQRGHAVPQILGLTATLGAQKANTVEKAVEKGITVMANLDVTKLSTVVRNTEEYDRFRKDTREERFQLPDIDTSDGVHRSIVRAMDKTEELIVSVKEKVGDKSLNEDERQQLQNTSSKRGSIKTDPSYMTWISELSSTGTTLLGTNRDIGNAFTVGSAYLKIYCEVLGVNDELTRTDALESLQRKLKGQNLGGHTAAPEGSFECQLANVAKELESDIENQNKTTQPRDGKKIHCLLKNIKEKTNKDTRFIVLVKTRETAEMLTKLLKKEGVKCAAFTGSTSSSEIGGTSRVEQERTVKHFNSGVFTGLVATNILEEGLDVADCSIVINYIYVGNEISTRQTAGRIRKMGGQHIVLANATDCIKHNKNVKRGELMDEAVKKILHMNHDEILEITKRVQAKLLDEEHKREAESRLRKRPRLENSVFKMVCKLCGVFQVDCSTIRSIENQHHVSIDPSVWERTSTKPFPKKPPTFHAEIACKGRMFGECRETKDGVERKCTHELGIVSTYKGIRLPFLSYKFLAVLNTVEKKTRILTKWDEAPFEIRAITEEDLAFMQTSI